MYKVFFAEDETAVRDMIIRSINWEEQGLEFCGVSGDGEEALPMILKLKPDILITDIKMPFMNGLELVRLARQELSSMSVIILSGYSDFDYMREAIHLGVTDYVLKPVTPVKLIQALGRAVQHLDEQRDQARRRKLVQDSNSAKQDAPVLSGEELPMVDREGIRNFLNTASEEQVPDFVTGILYRDQGNSLSSYFAYDVIVTTAKVCREMGLETHLAKEYAASVERHSTGKDYVELISDMFSHVIRMREGMSDNKTRLVYSAKKFMEENLGRMDLSLSMVASHIGITPNYLSTLFSKETGETFSEYLNCIRIRRAAQLLKSSSGSINQIAEKTGYSDALYFSKVFRRLIGMSPREFRRLK